MRVTPHEQETKTLPGWESETLSQCVKLAFKAMRREMDVSLRKSGMTVTQWRALGVILHEPGATHSDLMRQLEIEAPSVTSLVDGMERRGWVTRTRCSDDARVKRLTLTPLGRRVIEEAAQAMAPVEERMAATLAPQELDTLKRLLQKMVAGMQPAS